MASGYNMKCPVARTLDIIGERWTILLLRDLFLEGPRKFQDFQRALPTISPNTLSDRLKTLEENGVVARHFYEEHPPRAEYRLTDKGRTLGPIMKSLLDWGTKHAR
jgi:DNA-binding HxlR family transcriptional regulator